MLQKGFFEKKAIKLKPIKSLADEFGLARSICLKHRGIIWWQLSRSTVAIFVGHCHQKPFLCNKIIALKSPPLSCGYVARDQSSLVVVIGPLHSEIF